MSEAAMSLGSAEERIQRAVAKQEIAELRCLYGRATDLLGAKDPAQVAEGRAIYHRIFRPDAQIGAAMTDTVTGPDAWVDVVVEALEPYEATQHLMGTQLVDIDQLPGADGVGSARMTSYLQAWHAQPDGLLWLFIGTYEDELVHSEEHGWQIARMTLHEVSSERRMLGNL